jgi:Eukaryotic aspartyl protease
MIKPSTMCWLTLAVLFYGSGTRIHTFRVPTQKCMYSLLCNVFNTQKELCYSINSSFGVGYGIGGVRGVAYRDTVVIGDATGHGQFIGAANETDGFALVEPIDGIRTSPPFFSNPV